MLKSLYIKNYAIIDEIFVPFEKGFTIITGETGAGKSILVGALSLICGERAGSSHIKNNAEKCIVEAIFDIRDNKTAISYLQQYDFELGDPDSISDLIIRRELMPGGKSRVFINDTPATLNLLVPLSHLLLDLHRQFDTMDLQYSSYQLGIVDMMASNQSLVSEFEKTFVSWKNAERDYFELKERNRLIKQELDYHNFVFNEIESLNLNENEIEGMESEIKLLEQAEEYKQTMQNALQLLYESESPLVAVLNSIMHSFDSYSKLNAEIESVRQRLQGCYIELNDLKSEIVHEYEHTFYDEEKIALLTERLNEANRLLKKHSVNSTRALLEKKEEIEQKILQAETANEQEEKLFTLSIRYRDEATELSHRLSEMRSGQIQVIEKAVNGLLKKVGMPNATLKISHEFCELNATGRDKIEFLFDANKTLQFKPVSKVASGGELSRLMLCIKSMLAGSTQLPTLIFDEIDTGISGETAMQVGNIMKQMSSSHQLISITHLPQIAGKANSHIYIYKKENSAGQLHTELKKLKDEERVEVLAEMLSGKESSARAIEMVKELMK